MKKQTKLYIATALEALFVLWTFLVKTVDVASVGPNGSAVGFSTLNTLFHRVTGVNMTLYTVTDWLGLVPIFVALCFAILGLCQWIKRKSILLVDRDILALGAFYLVVMTVYILFEYIVVNYRPVLINGYLEASYPSSTTMLVLCVIPTAVMQAKIRVKNKTARCALTTLLSLFTLFMVIGRLLSGVHWLSDVVGGALISAGLVFFYSAAAEKTE